MNQSIMKTCINIHIHKISNAVFAGTLMLTLAFGLGITRADETCSSPYLARIEGQEEFVYVWTLGVEGLGDGSDKLVIVDVKPGSPTYGKVIHSVSVGGRNEAHHGGFTDDRRQLWLAGLDTSKIFIFDVYSDPAKPRLCEDHRQLRENDRRRHRPARRYALPGRVLIPCLSNAKDKGGRTALVEYSNDGDYIATHWLPTKEDARDAAERGDSPTAMATTRACCRGRTCCSPRPSPAGTTTCGASSNLIEGSRGDEALRRFDGDVGFPHPAAEEGFPSAGCAARNPLGLGREPQLRLHRHRADLEALARATG